MKKTLDHKTIQMLNKITDWDFNATPARIASLDKPAILDINPIPLIIEDIRNPRIQEVIEESKSKDFDLLKSGLSVDGDTRLMLSGNRAVAHALVQTGIAKLADKQITYPVYFTPVSN